MKFKSIMYYARFLSILLLSSLTFYACQDNMENEETIKSPIEILDKENWSVSEKLFFEIDKIPPKQILTRTDLGNDSLILLANTSLYNLNSYEPFIDRIMDDVGVPYWNLARMNTSGDSYILFVPLVTSEEVEGLFVFRNDPFTNEFFMTVSVREFSKKYGDLPVFNYYLNSTLETVYASFSNFIEDLRSTRGDNCHWISPGVNCFCLLPGCQPCKCVCNGIILSPENCNGSDFGGLEDGGAAEGSGLDLNAWIALINANWNYYINIGGGQGPRAKKRVKLIQDLANEQLVYTFLLDFFNANISEDGMNPVELLLAGNPQISNPIYLYLNGFYPNVTVVPQNALDLINLLLEYPLLDLSQIAIEHILTFEPELTGDILTFLDAHPNGPLALQIVLDFIDLQACDYPPCDNTDYKNEFEKIYSFYSTMSPNNVNWLSKVKLFLAEFNLDMPLFDFLLIYQNQCEECNESEFDNGAFCILVEKLNENNCSNEYSEAMDAIIADGNCNPNDFSAAFNAYFGVISEPSQQNTLPTLTSGSQLCAGIFDIQDAGDGIHEVGGISGLRFDVVNSASVTQTVTFSNLVIQFDKNINNPNCPGSSVANLMSQAVNEAIAIIRNRMESVLNYNQLMRPNTFELTLEGILKEKSSICVGHGLGGSSATHLTDTPASWTNSCGVIFTQFNTNHISNNNGADCQ